MSPAPIFRKTPSEDWFSDSGIAGWGRRIERVIGEVVLAGTPPLGTPFAEGDPDIGPLAGESDLAGSHAGELGERRRFCAGSFPAVAAAPPVFTCFEFTCFDFFCFFTWSLPSGI